MSSAFKFRFILRDFGVKRLWNAWSRSFLLNTVVRRCKRERGVISVLQCFRQTLLRPKRTLMLSVAACKGRSEDDGTPSSCFNDISDEKMQELTDDFDGVETLAKLTLFCEKCGKRIVVETKYKGIAYCSCTTHSKMKSLDGWVPYLEAEDVIVWRKESKPGSGLFIYKAYGRYKEIVAQDFAAVQLDGAYRIKWDPSVASIAMVEREANGLKDQSILHWEVLWPKFFANRDYVYIRRHKEFDVQSKCMSFKDGLFIGEDACRKPEAKLETPEASSVAPPSRRIVLGDDPCSEIAKTPEFREERPSVHSRAKRKAWEEEQEEKSEQKEKDNVEQKEEKSVKEKEETNDSKENKVYVIVSQSCRHPSVPDTKRTIRVLEYWSHMVIQTVNGAEEPGTEFVLTYFDVPAAGGMPSGVTSWASGRAVPVFLERMRIATRGYRAWLLTEPGHVVPDFMPSGPERVSHDEEATRDEVREQDMETFKQGPEMEGPESEETRDQGTQTDEGNKDLDTKTKGDETKIQGDKVTSDAPVEDKVDFPSTLERDGHKGDKLDEEDIVESWWPYI